jgi:hypothetical protein
MDFSQAENLRFLNNSLYLDNQDFETFNGSIFNHPSGSTWRLNIFDERNVVLPRFMVPRSPFRLSYYKLSGIINGIYQESEPIIDIHMEEVGENNQLIFSELHDPINPENDRILERLRNLILENPVPYRS